MSGLDGKAVRRGAAWTYAGQVILTLGHFVVGVILARLLGPGDFGVFIAVTAFTSIMLMGVQFGLPPAILQARDLDERAVNAAFWTMTALGLAFLGLAALIAEPLSTLYNDARFPLVMQWMAGIFLVTPYPAVGLALLRRKMLFDRVARIQVISFTAAAPIAIGVAAAGAGVYAMVLSAYLAMLINAVLIWRRLRWLPSLPSITPVRGLLGFSGFMTVNHLLHLATSRVDDMLLGSLLGTAPLGLYNRAYSLARIPSDQFADSLGPLMLGSLSRIQDDLERSRVLYFKAVSAIAMLTLPFLVFLLVGGPAAIAFLYGDQWVGAGGPLRVMVIGALFLMLALTLKGLINAQGMVRQLIPINLVALLVTVAAVIALSPWGLIAVAAGISLREAMVFAGMMRVLRRSRLQLHVRELVHALLPVLAAAGLGLAGGLAAMDYGAAMGLGDGLLLLILIGIGVFLCYGLSLTVLMLLWRSHVPLTSARGLLLEGLRRGVGRLRSRAHPT